MKQSLQLRLGQQLAMTPQLQQAIRLLQLSSLDLEAEIQEVLDSNLMLEKVDENNTGDDKTEATPPNGEDTPAKESATVEVGEAASSESLPEDLPVDSSWEDTYDSFDTASHGSSTSSNFEGDDRDPFERQAAGGESLHDHLSWQLQTGNFKGPEIALAEAIIDAISDAGYLSIPFEDVCQSSPETAELSAEQCEDVLRRVQQFDPTGVAARSPAECLLLQLEQLPASTPWREQTKNLISQSLEILGAHNFKLLMRRHKLSETELQSIITLIQSLDPHPGHEYSSETPHYVVPEVFVTRVKDSWRVELNPASVPKLRLNPEYSQLVRRSNNSPENTYLRDHLQDARWFLKSLKNRADTILRVATCIVERQRAFFEYGDEAMKPLILRDVAETVEMHESTISRVTTAKYMHTPRGLYEFKYFFSSHVDTDTGGECSSTAIRAMIKKLVAAESTRKPLSDSKIAKVLGDDGIQIARRTVAKYREELGIPSSTDRKQLT